MRYEATAVVRPASPSARVVPRRQVWDLHPLGAVQYSRVRAIGAWRHPGIAPNEGYRCFFRNIPYSEWYINSIRIKGSPAHDHHQRTYGGDASYFDFARQFKRESYGWQPEPWADLFREAGARYVVSSPSTWTGSSCGRAERRTTSTSLPDGPRFVGDLTDAVRARGMRMGLYYSSALDQSLTTSAMQDLVGLLSEGGPIDKRYAAYQLAHWRELIDRYSPSSSGATSPTRRGRTCSSCLRTSTTRYRKAWSTIVGAMPVWAHRFVRTRPGRALLNAYATRLLKRGAAGNLRRRTATSARRSSPS